MVQPESNPSRQIPLGSRDTEPAVGYCTVSIAVEPLTVRAGLD
jgi:hypothetical protein